MTNIKQLRADKYFLVLDSLLHASNKAFATRYNFFKSEHIDRFNEDEEQRAQHSIAALKDILQEYKR